MVETADLSRAASILESLLLVSAEPLPLEKIRQLLGGIPKAEALEVVRTLREKYPPDSSGILVEEAPVGRRTQVFTICPKKSAVPSSSAASSPRE